MARRKVTTRAAAAVAISCGLVAVAQACGGVPDVTFSDGDASIDASNTKDGAKPGTDGMVGVDGSTVDAPTTGMDSGNPTDSGKDAGKDTGTDAGMQGDGCTATGGDTCCAGHVCHNCDKGSCNDCESNCAVIGNACCYNNGGQLKCMADVSMCP